MLCTKCNFEFCWLCMSDWKVHGYNACNVYEKKLSEDKEFAQSIEDQKQA